MSTDASKMLLATLPPVPSLNSTFGAMLIGTFTGLVLYGLSLHQTLHYFLTYTGDTRLLKLMIFCLSLLDVAYTVTSSHACYHYLVANYFNPPALLYGVWSVRLLVPITGATIAVVQSWVSDPLRTTMMCVYSCTKRHRFYIRRVYLLGYGYQYVAIPATLFMLSGTGFAIACTVEAFSKTTFVAFSRVVWLGSSTWGCAMAADIMLTSSLIVFLIRHRTPFKRTNSMLSILLVYTVNTGLLTSAFNLLTLILESLKPNNMLYIAANTVAVRLYFIAVLTVLNSRRSLMSSTASSDGDFGTFGLSAPQQKSVRLPASARLDILRGPSGSDGPVIDIGKWQTPAAEQTIDRYKVRDGDSANLHEGV
ncbi:hypothetical protein BD311DRAFT_772176 [Dichomitus squalens]|uniref:DUF6534 domain-containing protein n=1 Tax=Dichomitus squalens TaxID=114155 RepID=A0A4Q9M3S2_9APHY|nr:hypothetical protein BD311DRAFT_772176 [Dichomitus squalens]